MRIQRHLTTSDADIPTDQSLASEGAESEDISKGEGLPCSPSMSDESNGHQDSHQSSVSEGGKLQGEMPEDIPVALRTRSKRQHQDAHTLDVNVIFFGMKSEIESFDISENEKLKFSCHEDITKSLSVVSQCNAFIGSDSAFKTMSSMLKIPTIVLCSKPKNNFRDRMFIDPYIKHQIMSAFKYTNFSNITIHIKW